MHRRVEHPAWAIVPRGARRAPSWTSPTQTTRESLLDRSDRAGDAAGRLSLLALLGREGVLGPSRAQEDLPHAVALVYPERRTRPPPWSRDTDGRPIHNYCQYLTSCPALPELLAFDGVSNIDDLLKHEESLIAVTRKVFDAFSPELMEALDTAMGMYTTFGRILGQDSDHAADMDEFNECARQLGAKDRVDLERIRALPTTDLLQTSLLTRLRAAEDRLEAKLDRAVILLQMGRAFSRTVVDVLRQRLTLAVGYQRPLTEGLALLFLTRDDPSKAIEWRKVVSDKDGRRFHAKYQKAVDWIIEGADLKQAYNSASGVSLHLRFAGAIGMELTSRQELSRRVDDTKLLFGELRPGQEFYFIALVIGLLQTQARIFARLAEAFPEARDDIWLNERVPRFIAMVERLRQRLSTAFPEQAHHLQRLAALGLLGKA
jgi:hypothetical protein